MVFQGGQLNERMDEEALIAENKKCKPFTVVQKNLLKNQRQASVFTKQA